MAVLKYHDGTGWEPVASALQGPTGATGAAGITGTDGNSYTAYRNLIINGAMQVAQRGTSVASVTGVGYNTADRWRTVIGTQGTWTQSVENDAPTGSGFRKSLKMLCTTADASPAAGDFLSVQQRLEGQNLQSIKKGTAAAEQLTLSFWVKSNVTGTYIANLSDVDNTRSVSISYTVSASATWEKKTITISADTTGAFDNDNAVSLDIIFWLGAGTDFTSGTLNTTWASTVNANRAVGQTNLAAATNNYWQVTGVQLEVGAVATPFEFKPFAQDLVECQRYYYRQTVTGASVPFFNGHNATSTVFFGVYHFPTSMRIAPTSMDTTGTAGDYHVTHTNTNTICSAVPTLNSSSFANAAMAATVASGLTQGHGSVLRSQTGNAYLGWSAEL